MARLIFERITQGNRVLRFSPQLVLEMVNSKGAIAISENDLDIASSAPTIAQLVQEVVEELFFLWDTYANDSQNKLTDRAKALQALLLKRCREENASNP